jgi:hypothetical protein
MPKLLAAFEDGIAQQRIPPNVLRKRRTNRFRSWFDKLTTNEINNLPFILSLSKDLISASLTLSGLVMVVNISSNPVHITLLGANSVMFQALEQATWGIGSCRFYLKIRVNYIFTLNKNNKIHS